MDSLLIDAFIAAGLNETHTRNDDYEILQLLKEPGTTQANILNRILKRDLYEAISKTYYIGLSSVDNPKDITREIELIEKKIQEKSEDIYFSLSKFDYGHDNKDPFANNTMPFYSKNNPELLITGTAPELPEMRPVCFQEIRISCVSKTKLEDDLKEDIVRVFDKEIGQVSKMQSITYNYHLISRCLRAKQQIQVANDHFLQIIRSSPEVDEKQATDEKQILKLIEEYRSEGNSVEKIKSLIDGAT
uniref:Uncharacterized protein n=1 Tax=Strigamia maritima TaxID=126957 RepID=T1JBU4_STRMM